MKKFFVFALTFLAGAINMSAQDCIETSTTLTGTASVTFTRYVHKIIPGAFSVGEDKHVIFASGNLQYNPYEERWRFAENQYDVIGSGNNNVAADYDGWIDLFGWVCSGYNNGADAYMPYSTNNADADYYAGTSGTNYSETELDWAWHNTIINGGIEGAPASHKWRVLTKDEWVYLFETRCSGNANQFYGFGTLFGQYGLFLLPDNWDWSELATEVDAAGLEWTPNTGSSETKQYSCNEIEDDVAGTALWEKMEAKGAVFLPAGGYRRASKLSYADRGFYWSSTSAGSTKAYILRFYPGDFKANHNPNLYDGRSVRPVYDIDD